MFELKIQLNILETNAHQLFLFRHARTFWIFFTDKVHEEDGV